MFKYKAPVLRKLIEYTGPELAAQEALYGFVMGLIFILSAQLGVVTYNTPWDIVILIIGMNFVWGSVDMYIFYKMDVVTQRRYLKLLRGNVTPEEQREGLYESLGNTAFGVLSEDDKNKAVDLLINGKIETMDEIKDTRKDMLYSAISCFVITLMTVIPLTVFLLAIPDTHDALFATSLVTCLCLFFVGYKLEPFNSVRRKLITGVSIAVLAYALTFFATFLGG